MRRRETGSSANPPETMRILFLNDLGFQYGAGVGHARQIQSLLLGGHTVGAVCGADGALGDSILFTRPGLEGGWRGMRTLGRLFRSTARTADELVDGILMAVAEFYPDVVVVGNLHGAEWPLTLLRDLRRLGCRVVGYLHDLHLVTGRCVYPGDCRRYLTGCDAECPTATEYPALEPSRIAAAWRLRRELFSGADAVELATNSDYMRRTVLEALPGAEVRTIYLGCDETVFHPADRSAARARLGIDDDRPVVLTGAVNLRDRRKGAHHLRELIRRHGARAHFLAFGHPDPGLPEVRTLGYHTAPQDIARLYQAADVFVGTAAEEAFGQTVLEAALTGLPVAAFRTGGVPEIIQDDRSGLLVPVGDAAELGTALGRLLDDAGLRLRLGAQGRADCAERFSLSRQCAAWDAFLKTEVRQ